MLGWLLARRSPCRHHRSFLREVGRVGRADDVYVVGAEVGEAVGAGIIAAGGSRVLRGFPRMLRLLPPVRDIVGCVEGGRVAGTKVRVCKVNHTRGGN